jgi:hypothetical protein
MRHRYKLARWSLRELTVEARFNSPAWRSRRACWLLKCVGKLSPPRVQAAVFGTLWNRWTTARRFQKTAPCLLCQEEASDSIEHYSCCRIVREVMARFLRLDTEIYCNLHSFLLIHPAIGTREQLSCISLLIYGVYKLTNSLRPTGASCSEPFEALRQAVKEGAKGHSFSMKVLDTRWTPNQASTDLPATPLLPFDSATIRWRSLLDAQRRKRRWSERV